MVYHIKEKSFLAKIAAWKLNSKQMAIVFGSTIHLHNTSSKELLSNKKWLLHELKHIEQFKRYGFIKFIFLYLIENLKHGYINNKFEIEARNAEEQSPINQCAIVIKLF
ncbi:MAG: DUF4157 domain-containing protein [Chitinophagaceae bacterium]